MDISVIGPEKFAFQDMACIDLALCYRPFGTFSLVPEPKGGEDASLTWAAAPARTLEVQVKGAKGTAGITELTDYFAHYPGRKVSGSLLERLLDDDARHALFILTARCNDDLTPLLLARPLGGRPAAQPAHRALAEALRDELGRMAAAKPTKKASKLTLARLKDLAALATRPIADFERHSRGRAWPIRKLPKRSKCACTPPCARIGSIRYRFAAFWRGSAISWPNPSAPKQMPSRRCCASSLRARQAQFGRTDISSVALRPISRYSCVTNACCCSPARRAPASLGPPEQSVVGFRSRASKSGKVAESVCRPSSH